MDLTESTAPKSDQQNYDDYVTGPKTVTVAEVRKGTAEQPVEVHLVEYPGRPFKPSKSMRRVLVAAWGPDATEYTGRRMTLYGDHTVQFGGKQVGGIRISALSHLDKPLTLQLTVTRGKRAPFKVEPLPDAEPVNVDELTALFDKKGVAEDQRIPGVNHIIGRTITDLTELTPAEHAQLVARLKD